MSPLRFLDAHNHLQDSRLATVLDSTIKQCKTAGVVAMVVNGTREADWDRVATLAVEYPGLVIPSFGCHPWFLNERSEHWKTTLASFLDAQPSAVGEIGLDRWKPCLCYDDQEQAFVDQLELAAERNRPVSIHCLRAWGRLLELLRDAPIPRTGFLLHSYGGPAEMIPLFVRLGGYFSFPGYFMHERKSRHREVFKIVPLHRLLIETDAPDQPLPPDQVRFPLGTTGESQPLNHPANLAAVAEYLAAWRGMKIEECCATLESNFFRLFGTAWNPPAEVLT